jgi:hypothetical protein
MTVGVGVATAGTAFASSSGSDSATSAGGAWYQVWANGSTFGWHVNIGHTDERFYVAAGDVCGNTYYNNWNDVTQSNWNNSTTYFPCTLSWATLYPTDGGSQDGRTVSR